MARAFRLFFECFPERVLIFSCVIFERLPGVRFAPALNVNFFLRIFADNSVRSLHEDIAAVRTRRVTIVLEDTRPSLYRSDKGGIDITQGILLFGLGAVGTKFLRSNSHYTAFWPGHILWRLRIFACERMAEAFIGRFFDKRGGGRA